MTASISLESIPAYLVEKIPEVSFIIATMLMIFAGDYIMELLVKNGLRKMNFIARTIIFILYGLIVIPALSTICAVFLQDAVLYPYKSHILLVVIISFVVVGILLSVRYNMKLKL